MEEELYSRRIIPILICSLVCFLSEIASSDLSNSTKYVEKGGKLILVCRVPPTGMHLWYKDSKLIVPNSRNRFHLEQDSPRSILNEFGFFTDMRLIVDEVDEIHTGVYKCNNFSLKVFVVTENMIQTNEDVPGLGKLLVPGEPLVLQCNTTGCSNCSVVWYKDGQELKGDDHIKIFLKNNTVVINVASYNDSGNYVCAIDRKVLDVALNASISVQSEIKLEKFESSSLVVVQGNPLELHCLAKGAPAPEMKWFKGSEEITTTSHPRIQLLEHNSLKNAKLLIEEAEFEDRDHYTCEAHNQVNSANITVFIRIKDKFAALWPFLGICAEVAILCSIIFVYERRKSKSQFDEPDTDHPIENKRPKDQKAKDQDVRQRK